MSEKCANCRIFIEHVGAKCLIIVVSKGLRRPEANMSNKKKAACNKNVQKEGRQALFRFTESFLDLEFYMQIEMQKITSLIPYDNNPRINDGAVDAVANSIQEFGFKNPIIVDKNNVIVAGHTRLKAARKLGLSEVPTIRADDLSPEQVKAFRLVDNKTAELAEWDTDLLNDEIAALEQLGVDLEQFAFDIAQYEEEVRASIYTSKTDVPQYEITGECPDLSELEEAEKTEELLAEIEIADVTEEEKAFLRDAAQRHRRFNYSKIAEYYAHASKEMQELMENSALVIIDFDNAIRNGYVKLSSRMQEIIENGQK